MPCLKPGLGGGGGKEFSPYTKLLANSKKKRAQHKAENKSYKNLQ